MNVQLLNPPIVASKVRFVPHSPHSRTVCMRVEVFGCQYNIEQDGEIIGKANPISYRFVLTHNLELFYDFFVVER